jgi:hypothetical protein
MKYFYTSTTRISDFAVPAALKKVGSVAMKGMDAMNAVSTPLMIGSMVIPSADMRIQQKMMQAEQKKEEIEKKKLLLNSKNPVTIPYSNGSKVTTYQ